MFILSDFRNRFGDRLGSWTRGTRASGALEQELKGIWPRPVVGLPKHLDYEWVVGLPWYLKNIKGNRVLDAGFMAHLEFTKLLVQLGFEVYGVDLQAFDSDREGFTTFKECVWETPFIDGYIDLIVANSLLEHLGLEFYGQPKLKNAKKATMKEFNRILSPGGTLLLQVPYGKSPTLIRYKGQDFYRVLTKTRLSELLEDFQIEEKAYFAKLSKGWLQISEAIADKIDQGEGFPACLVYVKAKKGV